MLDSLQLLDSYRSGRNDLVRDFYLPCLGEAVEYRRAVGYFTSESLSLGAQGLSRLIARGGRMRLVASPVLDADDIDSIAKGYRQRDEVVASALLRELQAPMPDPVRARLEFLAWLISEERLEIRIALVSDLRSHGIYHEKIGIFSDAAGQAVVFSGSANESAGGLISNFESIDVYRSWIPADQQRIQPKIDDFEALWCNQTPNLQVMAFPNAAREELLRIRPDRVPSHDPADPQPSVLAPRPAGFPSLPDGLKVRNYQKEAIRSWFANNGRGVWRMATGTGKTITALTLMTKLAEQLDTAGELEQSGLLAVVLCPYQHLVTQWADEARRFGVDPILCFQAKALWQDDANLVVQACNSGQAPFRLLIVTNDTFQGIAFQRLLDRVKGSMLLIADEVHNAGAPRLRRTLPEVATWRLGLSATPERWYDDEGTQVLYDYFGPIIFEYDLESAIRAGALTPYLYFPVPVELESDELEAYLELTGKISRLMRPGTGELTDEAVSQALKTLLIARARLIASARGKLAALRALVLPLRDTTHNLFYCGDGQTTFDDGESETTIRQVDAVVRLLGTEIGIPVSRYTAETDIEARNSIRKRFTDGTLGGIVAIRCLDEGVDIPETRRAFILASSTNPKQFIQRRGRVLRRSPGKDLAEIYDFLVVPPAYTMSDESFNTERRLLRRELERVVLFAQLANNGPQALSQLADLRKRYHLMDVG